MGLLRSSSTAAVVALLLAACGGDEAPAEEAAPVVVPPAAATASAFPTTSTTAVRFRTVSNPQELRDCDLAIDRVNCLDQLPGGRPRGSAPATTDAASPDLASGTTPSAIESTVPSVADDPLPPLDTPNPTTPTPTTTTPPPPPPPPPAATPPAPTAPIASIVGTFRAYWVLSELTTDPTTWPTDCALFGSASYQVQVRDGADEILAIAGLSEGVVVKRDASGGVLGMDCEFTYLAAFEPAPVLKVVVVSADDGEAIRDSQAIPDPGVSGTITGPFVSVLEQP